MYSRGCLIFLYRKGTHFESSSKCLLYKYLPDTFSLQFYLSKNIPENLVVLLTKYRLSSHMLLVEQGRYNGTVRSMRICKYCNLDEVEDEIHFILICPFYKCLRVLYLKKYYWTRPSMFELVQLLPFSCAISQCICVRLVKNGNVRLFVQSINVLPFLLLT